MKSFLVIYTKGHATIRGPAIEFQEQPGKHQLKITASNRLEAYTKAHEHFTRIGLNVSVARDPGSQGNNLEFSDAEIESIRESKTPFSTEYTSGIRIHKIIASI